ncbi:hypothetical protein RclHR1_00070031 [Rhizophagus clarus]|uniref:Uncharacterized protein n=1 Tax=Rhizophagus clarus TaxID=94130 RepID=A0A2Z6RV76_9GLOM|nr:hypothetical protein RclHR1_00070031 [Rhizophagus clarus]GES78204.1 hypothetical protein GLOIN_2v1576745 [Rhizophagus clarus]
MLLSKIKILLDRTEPSNRLHVLVLDPETHCYLNAKISTPEEIANRNYKDMLNAFMIFRVDFCDAFNAAKSNDKFRKNSESFKDISFLWKNSPKEVVDEYERVFRDFKKLKPKKLSFINCYPHVRQESKNERNNISELFCNNKETENPGIMDHNYLSNNLISQHYGQINACVNNNDLNSRPETGQFGNSEVLTNLSDGTTYLASQPQYGGPEPGNVETILDKAYVDPNDLNSLLLEAIQFGNSGGLNIYNLSEPWNFETTHNNTIENSEVMVDNINYFIPQPHYLLSDNAAYNTRGTGTSFNSDHEYDDTSKSIIQPSNPYHKKL